MDFKVDIKKDYRGALRNTSGSLKFSDVVRVVKDVVKGGFR